MRGYQDPEAPSARPAFPQTLGDSHPQCTRGLRPSRRRTFLACASGPGRDSSGAGFPQAFPAPFDTEAPFRLFFFLCFLEAASPSPPTGGALEVALHTVCPEQGHTG